MSHSNQSPAQGQKERRITSLEIASISFKNHKELLRSIRNQELGWEKVTGRKFALSEYTDSSGRKLPMYDFNQAESLYIASKFDDVVRAKLVVRWMELEEQSRKKKITLREDEKQLLVLLDENLISGDQRLIAESLGVARRTVSSVKCGRTRSSRIMAALVDRAVINKTLGRQLVIGYSSEFINLAVRKLEGGSNG